MKDGHASSSSIGKLRYEFKLWASVASTYHFAKPILPVMESTRALRWVLDQHELTFLGKPCAASKNVNPRTRRSTAIVDVDYIRFTKGMCFRTWTVIWISVWCTTKWVLVNKFKTGNVMKCASIKANRWLAWTVLQRNMKMGIPENDVKDILFLWSNYQWQRTVLI